jgi:hypothetical protein
VAKVDNRTRGVQAGVSQSAGDALLRDQIILVVLGFVLTSAAGGLIAHYFQTRTDERNRRESERQAAATLFDEISRAMDRRLYRMWLWHWGLKSGDDDRIEKALAGYRTVLTEWNDNLNRNLALTYRYFGEGVWKYLDRALYEEFARIGRRLEDRYKGVRGLTKGPADEVLERQLQALSSEVYVLNRLMVALIQNGTVGLYQLKRKEWPEPPPWETQLRDGSQGPRVAEWQRDLNLVNKDKVEVDGRFGRATREATVALQKAHGLKPDGIVGERTRRKMDRLLPDVIAPTW